MDSGFHCDFFKYQGTGNDFVLIDNRSSVFPKNNTKLIAQLCDRKFGIGADGLILLENDNSSDFRMVYFNSDGNESTMCGNGGRCIVAFAKYLKLIEDYTQFTAVDGLHKAEISDNLVTLWMTDVNEILQRDTSYFLDTGSPHHVQVIDNIDQMDVKTEGAKIRYGVYGEKGCNINFVSALRDDSFRVRTYERGVENETLSCGTGVTAVALAMHHAGLSKAKVIEIKVEGGSLRVAFDTVENGYRNIRLIGPATLVFKGTISC